MSGRKKKRTQAGKRPGSIRGTVQGGMIARCELHGRELNAAFIHRRGCLLRGNRGQPCKHFQWYLSDRKNEGGDSNAD